MKYELKELTISDLVNLIDENRVDLNPEYQRNFIWSPNDQSDLVDTILKNYPVPNFFMYENPNGDFEMVDGQQRSKTIYRFVNGLISSSKDTGKLKFSNCEEQSILQYKLPFIIIRELNSSDSLRDFYVLINKKGKHLNVPEVNKSEHLDKNFFQLSNNLLDYQNLIDLNLFTEAARKRMNDRAYIEELLGYLKLGIKDKKNTVARLYSEDISDIEYQQLDQGFKEVIDKIAILNEIHPIKSTRFKQKNDFYTLFNFINENISEEIEILKYQYKILLILDGKDKEGRQLIRPSNEDCEILKYYANNCVTQSNSKDARDKRLLFFDLILKNQDLENNSLLSELLDYLEEEFEVDSIDMVDIGDYNLMDIHFMNN